MNEPVTRASQTEIALKHAERFVDRTGSLKAKISFIESKSPDAARIASLLAHCRDCNQWANRGPLYLTLAESYEAHMNLPPGVAVTPCANGGIALEALARFHEVKFGQPLRWVGSAFSFSNLGRGYFANMRFVDCDQAGMLDLSPMNRLDSADYDGFIVTNVFGLWRDFAPYISFARASGKAMLIDNAAGIDEQVPDWPYQSFSLHHTKPYGIGEGGFLISPRDEAETIYQLLNYGEIEEGKRGRWFNNGKLSDIACAYHLDRLARHGDWAPRYRQQAERIARIAADAGLRPLIPTEGVPPATSHPYLAPGPVPLKRLQQSRRLTFGKYYKPLSNGASAAEIFDCLVNIPTHPDVAEVSDEELRQEFSRLLSNQRDTPNA